MLITNKSVFAQKFNNNGTSLLKVFHKLNILKSNNGTSLLKGFHKLKIVQSYNKSFQQRELFYEDLSFEKMKNFKIKSDPVKDNTNFYYTTGGKYFNTTGGGKYFNSGLKDMIDPSNKLESIFPYKECYMREFFGIRNIAPLHYSEFKLDSLLLDAYKRGKESLESALQYKLSQFQKINTKISHKVIQCEVYVVTSQSLSGVRYVYGNLLAVVKLGCFTTVWYNHTECAPDFFSSGMVPDQFVDFFKHISDVAGSEDLLLLDKDETTQSIVESGDTMEIVPDELAERLPDSGLPDSGMPISDSNRNWICVGVLVCICVSLVTLWSKG